MSIKRNIQYRVIELTDTWAYNHKLLIVCMALVVVIGAQEYTIRNPHIDVIEVKNEVQEEKETAASTLEKRARALYRQNEAFDLEEYRQIAIREASTELLELSQVSPFVDYEAMRAVVNASKE